MIAIKQASATQQTVVIMLSKEQTCSSSSFKIILYGGFSKINVTRESAEPQLETGEYHYKQQVATTAMSASGSARARHGRVSLTTGTTTAMSAYLHSNLCALAQARPTHVLHVPSNNKLCARAKNNSSWYITDLYYTEYA